MEDCAVHNVREHGLADKVQIFDAFGQDAVIPFPIGLVFFDNGKVRETTAPQQSYFEKFLMYGAYI